MKKSSHGFDPGRRDLLRGTVAAAGGYALLHVYSPGVAWGAYRERELESTTTIRGQLTFEGKPPRPIMKEVNADPQVAGKDPRVWEGVTLGKGKGLKDALVVVNGVFEGKPLGGKPPLTYAQGATILPRVDAFAWTPDTTMEMENRDPILHSWIVSRKGEIKVNKAHPARAPNVSFTVRDPGLHELRCAPHQWERAFRMAVPHPYFAKSDEEGRFEIAGLPAGDYTVDIWAEGLRLKRIWVPAHQQTITLDRAFTADDLSDTLRAQK